MKTTGGYTPGYSTERDRNSRKEQQGFGQATLDGSEPTMATVANGTQAQTTSQHAHQQHQMTNGTSRNSPVSTAHQSRDASISTTETSHAAPPPPPSNASAPKMAKAKNKRGGTTSNDPIDAHKQLLSKISQLEATENEDASQSAEIDAEVKKANRDLSQMLNSMDTGKIDLLQKKYTDLLTEMKRVEREHAKAKKRADQLQKDKDEINKDRGKERSLKEKLEKLSRELTRENKKLKDEYRDLKEDSSVRNDELHQRLEALVADVEDVVHGREIPDQPQLEFEHDRMFREKFTSFLVQYEMRELHFQSQIRVKELELAQQRARHEQSQRAHENEMSKSHQLTRQVSTFSQTENELRGQLNVYVEKFKQVEDTLNNSNDLFLTFRKEMEEMSKKTKRLEKENLTLTRKQEATNKNIFAMAEERERNAKQMERLTKENEKLKRLCRAMQEGGYGAAGRQNLPAAQDGGGDRAIVPDLGDGEESDYDDEEEEEEEYDEDDDLDEDDEVYDEDTEEEPEMLDSSEGGAPLMVGGQRAFGPLPPPPPPPPLLEGRDRKPEFVLGGRSNGARGPIPLVNGTPTTATNSGPTSKTSSDRRHIVA